MTNDFISREAVLDELREEVDWAKENDLYDRASAFYIAIRRVKSAPNVDAAPVVHSYSEPYGENSNGTVGRWRCMNCKHTSLESGNYCIHCGAKMDAEADDA